MFSVLPTEFMSLPPWPPVPIEATLSLALGDFSWPNPVWRPVTQKPTPAAPVAKPGTPPPATKTGGTPPPAKTSTPPPAKSSAAPAKK